MNCQKFFRTYLLQNTSGELVLEIQNTTNDTCVLVGLELFMINGNSWWIIWLVNAEQLAIFWKSHFLDSTLLPDPGWLNWDKCGHEDFYPFLTTSENSVLLLTRAGQGECGRKHSWLIWKISCSMRAILKLNT